MLFRLNQIGPLRRYEQDRRIRFGPRRLPKGARDSGTSDSFGGRGVQCSNKTSLIPIRYEDRVRRMAALKVKSFLANRRLFCVHAFGSIPSRKKIAPSSSSPIRAYMTLSFVFSSPGLEPHRHRNVSCRTATSQCQQLITKLLGHCIIRSELPAAQAYTSIGIYRLRLHRSNRKNNGKVRSGSGTQCRSFAHHGKRKLERDFGNAAMIFRTWKSLKVCSESIFGTFWLDGWIRVSLRAKRRQEFLISDPTLFEV